MTVFKPPPPAFQPGFLSWIARLVASEVPVVLGVPGPPGHFPAGALLNDALQDAVSRRDLAAVQAVLSAAFANLATHTFNPVVHRHGQTPAREP
jgi:hypothetical protein